jgi:hypothetical protein
LDGSRTGNREEMNTLGIARYWRRILPTSAWKEGLLKDLCIGLSSSALIRQKERSTYSRIVFIDR